MNMDNFNKESWYLHRKLFHRFIKYAKYFRKATEELPEFRKAVQDAMVIKTEPEIPKTSTPTVTHEIISLLSSSSEEVSEDSVDDMFRDDSSESDVTRIDE